MKQVRVHFLQVADIKYRATLYDNNITQTQAPSVFLLQNTKQKGAESYRNPMKSQWVGIVEMLYHIQWVGIVEMLYHIQA